MNRNHRLRHCTGSLYRFADEHGRTHGSYYVKMKRGGKLLKQSLHTDDKTTAEAKAAKLIAEFLASANTPVSSVGIVTVGDAAQHLRGKRNTNMESTPSETSGDREKEDVMKTKDRHSSTFRLPADVAEEIRQLAGTSGMLVSVVHERACRAGLQIVRETLQEIQSRMPIATRKPGDSRKFKAQ